MGVRVSIALGFPPWGDYPIRKALRTLSTIALTASVGKEAPLTTRTNLSSDSGGGAGG